MDKGAVVQVLEEMAAILEITGADTFRVRAFSSGARALDTWSGDLAALALAHELESIRGIGKSLATVIADLVLTGRSGDHEQLRALIPETLLDLLRIPGVGPKKVRALYHELGVSSLAALEEACRSGRVQALKGFGAKSEAQILAGIERVRKYSARHHLPVAEAAAGPFLAAIEAVVGVERVAIAGSFRRRLETIGDLDLLVAARTAEPVRAAFLSVDGILAREAEGEQKCRVVSAEGISVDLRVVDTDSWGAALHYFTGSKEHNTRLRGFARDRGLKLNEYGLWEGERRVAAASEEEIFRALGVAFIEPEMREDSGEFELAMQDRGLPELVTERDLRGTLHCHTTASDGRNSLREMACAARDRGWEYLGIADHSRTAAYAGGLSIERLQAQKLEINALNEELSGITLLHGIESDILADGSLDYPDEVLMDLDYVVVSVHSGFSMSREDQTRRIERALRHPATSVWGHPTGRILLKREAYDVDLDYLFRVAADVGVIVELNANPQRLDIDWRWGARLRELQLCIGIHPDAHSTAGLADVRYGIGIARKAWLGREQISNTLPLGDLRKRLRRRG